MLSLILLVMIVGNTTVTELGSEGIEITFSSDKVTRDDVSFPEATWLSNVGEPDLPSLTYKIGIPQGGSVEVMLVNNDESVLKDITVEPAYYVAINETGNGESPVFRGEVYTQNAFFPNEVVSVSEPGYFRDLYTVDLRINPVRYNPVTKELRVSRNVRVSVNFKGVPVTRRPLDGAYEKIYEKTLINYAQCKNWRRIPKPLRQNPFAGAVWFKIEVEHFAPGEYAVLINGVEAFTLSVGAPGLVEIEFDSKIEPGHTPFPGGFPAEIRTGDTVEVLGIVSGPFAGLDPVSSRTSRPERSKTRSTAASGPSARTTVPRPRRTGFGATTRSAPNGTFEVGSIPTPPGR